MKTASDEVEKKINLLTDEPTMIATGCLTLQVHSTAFMPSIRVSDNLERDFLACVDKAAVNNKSLLLD